MARTTHGEIGYSLPGIVEKPPKEDLEILIKFAGAFDLAHRRFLDLQKAEAQSRETQIELALEKVRSRTMAMQHSDELQETSLLLDQEVRVLGISTRGCAFNIYGENDATEWFSSEQGTMPVYRTPRENVFLEYYEAGKRGESLYIKEFEGNACAAHYDYLCTLPVMGKALRELKANGGSFPKKQIDHAIFFKYGYLLFITLDFVPEAHDIFKRFAKVFEQTYTRFLDLQKAEAQAREAQIETALERVRSRTMAMQNSEELEEVILEVLRKLQGLGISMTQRATGIFTYEDENKDYTQWVASPEYNSILSFNTPYFDHPVQNDIWNARQNGTVFYAKPYPVEVKNSLFKYFFTLPALKNMPKAEKTKALNFKHYSVSIAFQKQAALVVVDHSGIPLTEAENSILIRLSKVFNQTYTRFLDLQKAEAQAREAQIEAALEKVRSRSMAMQKSTELLEVILVVSEQLQALEFRFSTASFLNNNLEDDYIFWVAPYGLPEPVRFMLPYKDIPMIRKLRNAQKKKLSFFTDVSSIKEHQQWFQHLLDYSKENTYSKEIIDYQMSKGLARSIAIQDNIMLAIANNKSQPYSETENKIIARFGQVFEQSYTRFLDLEKAEAQAKEAQIEGALEKVRSVTLSLKKSDELLDVAEVLYHQLFELGFNNIRNVIIDIHIDDKGGFLDYDYSPEMGKSVTLMSYNDHPIIDKQVKEIHASKDGFFEIILEGNDLQELIDLRIKNGEKEDPGLNFTEQLTYNLYSFGKGEIGISTFGLLSEDQKILLKRFRNVFTFAYKRYNDLKQAEELANQAQIDLKNLIIAKKKTDDALIELKATQSQLIQSEKMASLGELTAGIAHEIQNPLNFVNNFSEVSYELIDEIKESRAKKQERRPKTAEDEIEDEILEDIKQNLEKINHHGKRADAIVKGMLQHSRSSSGTKEPTDINKLADEYLRLAYHGLRAKDKSFNATLETDFDDSIGMVSVVPQDIGRVILNLITNAFYATNEKLTFRQAQGDKYEPTVTVSTKKFENSAKIKIKDNANGIPAKVLDKIFQPFFTTKPTGQGTGLGLSLAYDIVKAHGGQLKVNTEENVGTEFIISLTL